MILTKIRGCLALAMVGASLVVADVVMRVVVVPLAKTSADRSQGVLTWWAKAMARLCTVPFRALGVLSLESPPPVPGEAGTLLVMNHQSLFDIPILILAVQDNFPRIVTRARYSRSIPVVSQMTGVYGFPLVDPDGGSSQTRLSLRRLRKAARLEDAPLAIFPEGSRTRTGEIGNFKIGGLRVILKARKWRVHLLVTDGCWRAADLPSLISSPEKLRSRTEHAGVLDWTDPRGDAESFLGEIRSRMRDKLAAMRAEA